MDLLNIQDGTAASRPSLISSLWSLQVQLQTEPGNMNEDLNACGSKQSLPELMMNNGQQDEEQMLFNYNSSDSEQQPHFRSVKSLSDLNSFAMVPTTSTYQMAPQGDRELKKCLEDESNIDSNALLSNRLAKSSSVEHEQQHAMMGMSRQQKNSNICEWLQKLDLNSASNTGSKDVLDNSLKSSFNTEYFNK